MTKKIALFLIFLCNVFSSKADNSVNSQLAIFVYTPSSGQVLVAGTTTNITWSNANGITTSYYIDYSSDNAVSWTFISYHTANTTVASYTWLVPSVSSTQCYVRIRKTTDLTSIGLSPTFTINVAQPSVTLVNPNGGQTFTSGGQVNIIWGSTGVNQIDIHLSTDGGNSWSLVTYGQFTSASYYTWTVPAIVSTTCKIRIRSTSDSTLTDQSSSNFSIIIPSITVNVPNGGQNWQAQTNKTIYWSSTTLSGTNVNIEYSIDSGATWLGIAYGTYNIGSKVWYVPNTPSTKCFIKISDASNPNTFDISNATFTISPLPGSISLLNFINSTFVAVGNTVPIVYSSSNVTNVNIDYSIDYGLTWINIVTNTPANGMYNWIIPNTLSQTCLMRVSNSALTTTVSQSINPFTIFIPSLHLLTPNGGETLQGGSTFSVSWSGIPTQYYVNLQYQTSINGPWINFAQAPSSGFNATNSYNWTVPNITSSTCRFRIVDNADTTIFDVSDSLFTINYVQSDAYLLLPYGGISIAVNSVLEIQWSVVNVDTLDIYFSSDGGTSWQLIASGMTSTPGINSIYSSGYYDWTTPNILSNNCIIKIVDKSDSTNFSQNIPTFSLVNPYIEITSPNGFEQLQAGSAYTIYFNNSGTGNLNLFYSTDGGLTWDTLASNYYQGSNGLYPNSYNWIIPNINSNNCLIKVENLNGQIIDFSNNTFSINGTITQIREVNNSTLTLFPNPCKDLITVNKCENYLDFKVFNILGDELLSGNMQQLNNQSIDISNLPDGSYLIDFIDASEFHTIRKFIVKK